MRNFKINVDKKLITQDVINLYHDFTHGDGDRRKAMASGDRHGWPGPLEETPLFRNGWNQGSQAHEV